MISDYGLKELQDTFDKMRQVIDRFDRRVRRHIREHELPTVLDDVRANLPEQKVLISPCCEAGIDISSKTSCMELICPNCGKSWCMTGFDIDYRGITPGGRPVLSYTLEPIEEVIDKVMLKGEG